MEIKYYNSTHKDIVFWLEDRVVPKERDNINEILKAMGLIDYDFWELCRRTRAMCLEDYFRLSKGEKYYLLGDLKEKDKYHALCKGH